VFSLEKTWVLTLPLKEVSKKRLVKKTFWPQKTLVQKDFCPQKNSKNSFSLKKILVKEIFGKQNFW